MSTEILNSISKCVQPMVVNTGIEGALYNAFGSSFLAKYENKAFVITARHNLSVVNGSANPICLSPYNYPKKFIPLKFVFKPKDEFGEDDFDWAIIEIDLAKLDFETIETDVLELANTNNDWFEKRENATFYIWGYPEDYSYVDYDRELISNKQIILAGKYVSTNIENNTHCIKISRPTQLTTYSGFSGGPVFSTQLNAANELDVIFCGMVIRGTKSSSLMHFIDRNILFDALINYAELAKNPAQLA